VRTLEDVLQVKRDLPFNPAGWIYKNWFWFLLDENQDWEKELNKEIEKDICSKHFEAEHDTQNLARPNWHPEPHQEETHLKEAIRWTR